MPCIGATDGQFWLMVAMGDCQIWFLDTLAFQHTGNLEFYVKSLFKYRFKYLHLRSKTLFETIPCGLGLICEPPAGYRSSTSDYFIF